MEKAEVIHLKDGNLIKVDLGNVEYTVYGPATVVVIKKESAAKEATATTIEFGVQSSNPEIAVQQLHQQLDQQTKPFLQF